MKASEQYITKYILEAVRIKMVNKLKGIKIKRFPNNPLLEPGSADWMKKNVFNCGVIIDDGLYKMLFRGAYTKDQSKSDCGLAISSNGIDWDMVDKPVLQHGFNNHCKNGIEDPRIIKWIDGYNYIFATAVSSSDEGRVGIWRTKNFFTYEWVGIPFNSEDKDAAILSEPIDGWAYLLHRRSPNIWISRTRDLTLKTGWQDSKILSKLKDWYSITLPYHEEAADKIGIAGPPLKTPKGWLVITHIVHQWDKGKSEFSFLKNRMYSLGFMVLDLEDPTKVNYIHPGPILIPETREEIGGIIPNVVFSCATVDTGGDLIYIYWGGADTVICGGSLSKSELPMCY